MNYLACSLSFIAGAIVMAVWLAFYARAIFTVVMKKMEADCIKAVDKAFEELAKDEKGRLYKACFKVGGEL